MKAATNAIGSEKYIRIISIHAAREGGDYLRLYYRRYVLNISIHAAREGGDRWSNINFAVSDYFNPRRP